jgi:heme exporter protein D
MNLGPHAAFIVVSYAVAASILLSLIVWIVLDHRAQKRALDELEASGHTRRSSRGTP